MADNKSKQSFAIIVLAALAVLVAGYFFSQKSAPEAPTDQENISQIEETEQEIVTIDVSKALAERVLGDASAPIKISEYASLTCSHCAQFHTQTFAQLKSAYIDTGKAYLVFSDFPLNAPALHASMVARCLPEDKYFDFISMLFARQEEWAFDANYLTFLKSAATENGLSASAFKACLDSKELQDGIVNRVRAVQTQWQIDSTPSFVINNKNIISGALPFADFEIKMNEALSVPSPQPAEAIATEAPAPVVEEPAVSAPEVAPPVTENEPDQVPATPGAE